MAQKITAEELDKLIRKNIQSKGLSGDISEEKIAEIKKKIKEQAEKTHENFSLNEVDEEPETVVDISEVPQETPGAIPSAVEKSTQENVESVELAKKEGELEEKEKQVSEKEVQLNNKEEELQQKQEELSYKPQLPAILEGIGVENMFVFSENELSLGAEALKDAKLRLCSEPDIKKSMHDIWLENGKTKSEVYLVNFEKIGEMTFDPFQGTANFEAKKDTIESEQLPAEDITAMEKAMESQNPTEPMIDAVEPIKDVVMQPSSNMGLDTVNVEAVLEKKIEEILKNYFLNQAVYDQNK